MPPTKEDVLDFGIFVDIRDALRSMEQFQRETSAAMKQIAKSGEMMGKASEKASKKAAKASKEQTAALEDVSEAYGDQQDAIANVEKTIDELSKLSKKAHGEEKALLEADIKALKKIAKARKDATGNQKEQKGGMFFGAFSPKKVAADLKDTFKELGESLKAPLQAFLAKDAKGLVESSFKLGGGALSKTLKGFSVAGGGISKFGSKMGGGLSAKGKARGGVRGGLMRGAGEATKLLGGALGGLGKTLGMLGKLGPILGVIGSGIAGLLKLFIDADAMVKEFNKSILQSSSTAEFLANAQGDVAVASVDMEQALMGVRDAAMDAKFNLDWGITKSDHQAVFNVLNQEGVALGHLSAQAGMSRKRMEDLSKALVSTGVAYSRHLGVPLSEIGQLQAHMMVEMGASVETTEQAFANMTRAATESGIAGNKFFAMIRAVSQDLSLWNLRMEDSVNLLGKLGRVMSPRSAQMFFQELSSGFKQMGRQDLLKQTMLAGVDKVRKIVAGDITDKQGELAKDIAAASNRGEDSAFINELSDKIKKGGYKAAFGAIRDVAKGGGDQSKIGVMREKAAQIQMQQTAMTKGTYGVAMASGDIASLGGQLEIAEASLERFGGDMVEAYGSLGQGASAEALGKSQEQVKQLVALRMALEAQKDILISEGKTAAEVNAMTTRELIAELDEGTMAQIKKEGMSSDDVQKAIMDLAKDQGTKTQSITDQLEVLVDWFMNQFYNLMLDIWEILMKLPWVGGDANKTAMIRSARESGSQELTKIASRGGDVAGNLSRSQVMKDVLDAMRGRNEGNAEKLDKVANSIASKFEGKDVINALKDVGFDPNYGSGRAGSLKKAAFGREIEGGDFVSAAKEMGASQEQITDALGKLAWYGSDTAKIEAFGGAFKTLGGKGKADTTPSTQNTRAGAGPAGTPEGNKNQEQAVKIAEENVSQTETTNQNISDLVSGSDGIHKVLSQQGIKIDRGFLKSDLAREMETAMLAALRQALFEYYLYSGIEDRSKVAEAFGKGGGPKRASEMFGDAFMSDPSAGVEGALKKTASANARGGMVTGVAGGLAQVTAAAGEGLASVGRGERIVPAGGGGTNVSVAVNGIGGKDLANLIEGKVVEGIREFKRRERFD